MLLHFFSSLPMRSDTDPMQGWSSEWTRAQKISGQPRQLGSHNCGIQRQRIKRRVWLLLCPSVLDSSQTKKTRHSSVLPQSLMEIFHLQTSPRTLKNLILHSATFLPLGVRSYLNKACPDSPVCTNYATKSQVLSENKKLTAFSVKQKWN